MSISVLAYTPAHAAAFRHLHRACLAHYDLTPTTEAQEARVLALLQAERHMACHLAFEGDEPVGFATWGLCLPAGAGVSLVMKELFVATGARGRGVGRHLLRALVDVARAEGCERLDWATDGDNAKAQAFYAAIGAPLKAKQAYSVPWQDFDRFASGLDG